MTPETGRAVEVERLVKTFGDTVKALDGLSFAVESGTIFGLLGPNGAGKTTAIRILTTILTPDAGTARVLDHDVTTEPDVVRASIGLAGQYAAVDENLTGRENLRLIGQLCHLPRRLSSSRAGDLLERFDLADAAGRPVKTYSGGMRRRLDVAAALVDKPSVLFLDEPTTGLDPHSRTELWRVIEELVGEGTTVLLTTQYLEEVDRLAERLVVVDHGVAIAEGTPAQLKAELGATVLDVGMGDDDAVREAMRLLSSVWPKPPVSEGRTIELSVDEGPRMVGEALRILEDHGLAPSSLALRDPSLDDVFLALTGHRTAADDDTGKEPVK